MSKKTVDLDRAQKALEREREDALLARNHLPMFAEFFLRWERDPKRRIQLVDMHIEMMMDALKYRDLVIMASPGFGKCMIAGSPVQLADGRQVPIESMTEQTDIVLFDPQTCTQHIAKAGPVIDNGLRDCVRVTMRSGRVFGVTMNHRLWGIGGWKYGESIVVGDMLAAVRGIELGGLPMDPDEAELLGYMVAEGTCKYASPHWTNHNPDIVARMRELCTERGWQLKPVRSNGVELPGEYYLTGEAAELKPGAWCRKWGIAKLAKHKRVPQRLFQADKASIAAFLGALVACDGHVNERDAGIEITLASEGLIADTRQLLLRLGIISQTGYRIARYKGKAFNAWRLWVCNAEALVRFAHHVPMVGPKADALERLASRDLASADTRDVVPLEWQMLHPVKPGPKCGFRRVADKNRMPKRGTTRAAVRAYVAQHPCWEVERAVHDNIHWDEVVSVERLENVQTWGIPVEHESHAYLSDGLIHHNTNLITYALTIWEAGHRPETYTSIVGSKLRTTAFGFTRAIRNYIENNEWVRMCFPNLRPSLDRWSIEELEVAVHNKAIKDPTWRAIGNDAGWQGSRHSRQVFDDMIDGVLARSKMLCEQQAEWVHSGFDRLDLDNGGKRVFIQNRFRRWDTGQILVDKHKWHLHMACIRDPVTKKTRFPEKFPQEDLDNWPPTLAALQLDCIPPTEGEKIFEDAFIDKCRMIGMDETMIGRIDGELPEGVFVVHAVDPAGGPEEGSDDTAIMTGLAGPPSYFLETLALPIEDARRVLTLLPEHAMVIRVLWLTIGKMGAPEIKAAIADVHKRYGGFVMVEKNGVQKWMKQLLAVEHPEIVVHSWRTGGNKYDETLGIRAEANHFSVGMWVLPTRKTPEGALVSEAPIEKFIRDLGDYDPSGHTPDSVSACWILRNAVRLYRPFGYEAAVAGDQVTKEELFALGYKPEEVMETLPEVFDGGRPKKVAPAKLIAGSELGPRDPELTESPAAPKGDDRERKMRESQKRQLEQTVRSIIRPTSGDEIDDATLAEIESKYF